MRIYTPFGFKCIAMHVNELVPIISVSQNWSHISISLILYGGGQEFCFDVPRIGRQ